MAEGAESRPVIPKRDRLASDWAIVATLLYLMLADATVEAFLRHPPLQLWVAGTVGAYLVLNLVGTRLWHGWNGSATWTHR